jgi:MerR family transcriptional regulator, redox-sensitive transcriptional activator SoxR
MTIGDLSAKVQLPASTIRYWERIGVLPKAARVNGQRRYGPDAVHRVSLLQLAQACGFRLDEMRHLITGFRANVPASRRWQDLTRKKLWELDDQIARLEAMRQLLERVSQCKCADLADCGRIAYAVTSGAQEL